MITTEKITITAADSAASFFLPDQVEKKPVSTSPSTLQKKENMIFLVPSQILDESSFCNYVKKTAEKKALSVFFLMLASNYKEEANGHLKLISITSALVGHSFHVDSQLVLGNSWIDAIHKYSHPEDVVFCPKEIQVASHIFFREPLADQLVRKIPNTVQIYSEFVCPHSFSVWKIGKRLLYWIGVLFLLAGFLKAEGVISDNLSGAMGSVIMFLIVAGEIILIYFWSLFLG
jgi:hypothetical protein